MSGLSRDLQAHDAPLTLKTLGGAAVFPASQAEAQPPLLGPGKPLALYAYLACVGGRVSREQLADLLWSDLEPESARHALRQAIWTLKKRLGEDAIAADATDVRIGAPAHSDRQAFLEAVTRQDLATALDLYTGDCLPSFAIPGAGQFELWADLERRQLRSTFVRAADRVAREHISTGRFRDAVVVAKRVRDADPDSEAGWRLLLESLLAARDTLHAAIEAS